MMTDPISDMLSRIRNASPARHDRPQMPTSRIKASLAKILVSEGFITDCREEEGGPGGRKNLTIVLKYGRDRVSAIDGIRRGIRQPGRVLTRQASFLGVVLADVITRLETDTASEWFAFQGIGFCNEIT